MDTSSISICATLKADIWPIKYNFTSGPLLGGLGIPAGIKYITAVFTADLSGNLVNAGVTAIIADWSINDGHTTFDSGTAALTVDAYTDAAGIITDVHFNVDASPTVAQPNYFQGFGTGIYFLGAATRYCTSFAIGGNCETRSGASSRTGQLTRVPEPGTFGLLGLGLIGIGMARKFRMAI